MTKITDLRKMDRKHALNMLKFMGVEEDELVERGAAIIERRILDEEICSWEAQLIALPIDF